jgi:hypothetical protein
MNKTRRFIGGKYEEFLRAGKARSSATKLTEHKNDNAQRPVRALDDEVARRVSSVKTQRINWP